MTKKQRQKPYWEMTTKELVQATAEFDDEFVADTFSTLSAEDRARWEQARKKPTTMRNGKATRQISIRLSQELLARCDALARKMRISRERLISRGLKAVLAAEGEL